MQVATREVETRTIEIVRSLKRPLPITSLLQGKVREVTLTTRWLQKAVVRLMISTIKESDHLPIITVVVLAIIILETSHRRRTSIVTNTISLHRAGKQNLLIIVVINMRNRSTCHRNAKLLVAPLEIKEEAVAHITMVVATLIKTIKITNTTTNRTITIETVTKVMEISNNKKTMAEAVVIGHPQCLTMKTRLISKLSLH